MLICSVFSWGGAWFCAEFCICRGPDTELPGWEVGAVQWGWKGGPHSADNFTTSGLPTQHVIMYGRHEKRGCTVLTSSPTQDYQHSIVLV